MMEKFLRIDKALLGKGLNPTELLIIAQIMEFEINKRNCYMTDKQFAEQFGVSESTVSRAVKELTQKQLIDKSNKRGEDGRFQRTLRTLPGLTQFATGSQNDSRPAIKMTADQSLNPPTAIKMTADRSQNDIGPSGKMTADRSQNDRVKYNIKDNIKDKEKKNPAPASFEEQCKALGFL